MDLQRHQGSYKQRRRKKKKTKNIEKGTLEGILQSCCTSEDVDGFIYSPSLADLKRTCSVLASLGLNSLATPPPGDTKGMS